MDRNNLFLTSSAWLMRHLYSSTYVCKYCSFSLIIPTATFLHFFAWFINISCALYTDSLRDLSKILCLKNSNCFSLLTQEKANFDFTLWVKTYCSWIFSMAPSTSSFLIFIDCMWLKKYTSKYLHKWQQLCRNIEKANKLLGIFIFSRDSTVVRKWGKIKTWQPWHT